MPADEDGMEAEGGEQNVLFFNNEGSSSGGGGGMSGLASQRPEKMVMMSNRPGTSSKKRPGTSSRRPGTSGGKKAQKSMLRKMLDEGTLPVKIVEHGLGKKLKFTVPVEELNYNHILPILFSGIQEKQDPYRFVAFEGVFEVLETAADTGVDLLQSLPQLMKSIKQALNTRDPGVVYATLKVLQQLAICEGIGQKLPEYYRQILPVCNILKDKHLGSGRSSISDSIQETLELLEAYGGKDALEAIKRMVPTYESCLCPPEANRGGD